MVFNFTGSTVIKRFREARLRKAEVAATTSHDAVAVSLDGVTAEVRLGEIPLRETVELVRIDLPGEEMEPLLELGLLPGCQLCPVRHSPFGDPVLMVDGALIALRREMAGCLCVRRGAPAN